MKKGTLLVVLSLIGFWASCVYSQEIGFVETFGIAKDRSETLKQLIPGTEEYYFFSCLHAQHTGNFEQVHKLLKLWIERYGNTQQVKEILNRQALLEYEKNPEKSLAHIRQELNLRFDHSREVAESKTSLPSKLDSSLISTPYLIEQSFARYPNLDGIEDAGLDILDHDRLDPLRRRNLLQRLERPDIPNLPKLVVDDLLFENSAGFGAYTIHSKLLVTQLDECKKLLPELSDNSNFISIYLTKLAPSDDIDFRCDPAEKKIHLYRLWNYVKGLSPAHNSLKAHVLYNLLDFNRTQGNYDEGLFIDYIKLPREVSYINPAYIELKEFQDVRANLNTDFQNATLLPAVGADVELVKDYLSHFLLNKDDYNNYIKYIQDDFLKDIFVETKIVNGIGNKEKWYSLMPPVRYQALKERVDLDFLPYNQKFYSIDQPVKLDLNVKNIKTLIVKIYELNTFNYYRSALQEIDTSVNLDGLVASDEKVISYTEPPLMQVKRTFEFPQINKPGVFVVEFIGSGKSSRAIIRKGKLSYADKIGPSGQEFVILNDKKEKQPQATLWLSGREFKPDQNGIITVPFTNHPGREKIILKDDNLCSLTEFEHLTESYSLSAGFFVDRETLMKGVSSNFVDRETLMKGVSSKVAVRPVLMLNSHPVSLSLLEDVRLSIESVDRQGISCTRDVSPFNLSEDKESLFEFQVPKNLANVRFTLKGQVKNLSQNKKQDLSDSADFPINGIDGTLAVEDIFLTHTDNGYFLELLGKNGEIRPDSTINIELKHRFFSEIIHLSFKSNQDGKIDLGKLPDIEWVKVTGKENASHQWHLSRDLCRYPAILHGQTGNTIRLPYTNAVPKRKETRLSYVLLEKRGPTWISDHTDAVIINDGFLEIKGLLAGDYDLFIKNAKLPGSELTSAKITIRLTDGKEDAFFVSGRRILEIKNSSPLHISSVDSGLKTVQVKLGNPTQFSRLHVFATRYMPIFHPFSYLGKIDLQSPWQARMMPPETLYVAGRNIGDEYRYILDRKYTAKFSGNMLERPGLLLNPWNIRKTETAKEEARPGEEYSKKDIADDSRENMYKEANQATQMFDSFSSFDFLAHPSVSILNLKPDDKGIVSIDRKLLGDHQQIHLVATDPINTVYREITLPGLKDKKQDLRLAQGLSTQKHFTEQKQITFANSGETFTINDIGASEFEVYDSLDQVYRLMATLSSNTLLQEFSFIMKWPDLTPQEKEEKYSAYACHELNFFLYHKDRPFFDKVVLPYLANKKDKTFMDYWLLKNSSESESGKNLTFYLNTWPFSQLNIAEKILLARGGPGDKTGIQRHVKDLFDMIPFDVDAYNRLFDTALKGRALEEQDLSGTVDDKKQNAPAMSAASDEGAVDETKVAESEREFENNEAVASKMEAKSAALPAPARMKAMKKLGRQDALGGKGAYFKPRGEISPEQYRIFYQKLDNTMEWVENNYYKLPIEDQNASLVTVNPFWKDFAQNDPQKPFFSTQFFYATKNFTEMILALSVLDLPFKAKKHESHVQGNTFTLKASSPLIIFHKEIREANPSTDKIPILVSQNIFNPKDRYRYVDNEQFDKFIDGECLIRIPYGCQVVMSNPTSSLHKIRVLFQIPQGAIPVMNGFYTKSLPMTLAPFSTRTFEYFFYFPETGSFKHYPIQVSKHEQFISSASETPLNAVVKLGKVDTESWDYISQNSSDSEVLKYFQTNNVNRVNLEKIAYRMKNKGFFEKTIKLLQERQTFHPTLWSYSIYHNTPSLIAEYLKQCDYSNQCGLYIKTQILTIDPIDRKTYQHKEYKPLINARAHQLGKGRKILNDRFYEQYNQFMKLLCYHPSIDNELLMGVTHYLLLQDRADEAVSAFNRIDVKQIAEQIQYDYLKTYIAFYQAASLQESKAKLEDARNLIDKYKDYPVPRWCNLFKEAANQLDDMTGKSTRIVDQENREHLQAKLAATEPALEISIESKKITLRYQNLSICQVNYYPMDIELLFSRNPFVRQQTEYFAYIKPNETSNIVLPSDKTVMIFDLPKNFHNSNLMVEAISGGIRKSLVYYANSLDIKIIENYGQVRISHQITQNPLAKVYVKVYAKMKDGSVQFYKDGYTDLRGRFDYISLNTNEMDYADRLSILMLSDEYGAEIREVGIPKR